MKSIADRLNELDAKKEQGNWIPACGGSEKPFTTRTGRVLQYVYQPSTGRHAYIDCGTDILLTDEEAMRATVGG